MAFGNPTSDLRESVDQSTSGIGVVGSVAMDWLKWSTWRNPFFTHRMGAAGWDPKQSKLGGFLNKVFAPEAGRIYGKLDVASARAKRATTNIERASRNLRSEFTDNFIRNEFSMSMNNSSRVVSWDAIRQRNILLHRKLKTGAQGNASGIINTRTRRLGISTDAAAARGAKQGGVINWLLKLTGERTQTQLETQVGKRVAKQAGLGSLFSKGASWAQRHNAAMRLAGRGLTAMSLPLLAVDAATIALSGATSIAEFGAQQALRPTHTMGPGVRSAPGAENLRRKMIMEMHSSQFGPRRLMGNEAGFLHV